MINLAEVRALGHKPRVHGNGFIQLDLTKRSRLHVFGDKRIPRQKVPTPIHDHVFTFESRVIVGRLINVIYEFIEMGSQSPTAEFRIYSAQTREGDDTILVPTDTYGYVTPVQTDMVMAATVMGGNKYTMPSYWFHDSVAPDGPTATIITKHGMTQRDGGGAPRVLVPRGQEPDNEFNRHHVADEDKLWRIIEQTLAGRKRR
jgi:hypothetical protein